MNPSINIGKNIAILRTIKGIKQSVFAKSLGITQQAVSKMENSTDINYSRLVHVSQILGVSIETIRTFNESVIK